MINKLGNLLLLSLGLIALASFCSFLMNEKRSLLGVVPRLESGQQRTLYPSGEKKCEGRIENNRREGLWRCWFENGKIENEINFKFGRSL